MKTHPHLHPATEVDESFLVAAFLSGRPELDGLPADVYELQLRAQRAHYALNYPHAVEYVVHLGDQRVGRCIVSRDTREYKLLDISILGSYRGQGIASALIHDLLAQAAADSVPLRLSVWQANVGALRLYRRLGFTSSEEHQGYVAMQATSGRTTNAAHHTVIVG